MRSLFIKIFLSFLLITLLASVTTALISYWAQIGPYGELRKRIENHQYQTLAHTLSITGMAAEKILISSGEKEVVSYLQEIEKTDGSRIMLLKGDNTTFSGHELLPGAENLAESCRNSLAPEYNLTETELMVALPLADGKAERPMVIIGKAARIFWPPAIDFEQRKRAWAGRRLSHFPMGLPLIVVLLVAASGCFLLARSLTAPIRTLRKAVQQIAGGDFSARVHLISRRKDEIADLSQDFNTMAERTQSLLQSQKRLLRDISHELRSPLTRQNVALELARQQPASAGPYLDRIGKESDRLNELIDQLLLLTRLEGDVDTAAKETVDLSRLVKRIVHDADFEAVGSDKKIVLGDGTEATVLGSGELLGRALENVIRNGLRYTPEHSAVEISIKKTVNHISITVKDHGPGVPEQYLDEIFRPFFRVADARDRDSGGTGIGLAIARQALLLHGGSIQAENSSEGGLVITMKLPVL